MSPALIRRKSGVSILVSIALSAIAVFSVARLSQADNEHVGQLCLTGYAVGYRGCVVGGGGATPVPTETATASPTASPTPRPTASPEDLLRLTATSNPPGVTAAELHMGGSHTVQLGPEKSGVLATFVVLGGGTGAEVVAGIQAAYSERIEIVWCYMNGSWLFYLPSDPASATLQTIPSPANISVIFAGRVAAYSERVVGIQ